MDIAERLAKAVRIVDEAEVATDLRATALGCVFDALGTETLPEENRPGSAGGRGDAIGKIAARLDVARELVEQAFVVEGDAVEIVIPPSRFDLARSRATEQIALLVAAARQAGGLDSDGWTSVDHIRVVCEHFRRLDTNNFASTIKAMDDLFAVRGDRSERKVRMSAPAWQRARVLLSTLIEQPSV